MSNTTKTASTEVRERLEAATEAATILGDSGYRAIEGSSLIILQGLVAPTPDMERIRNEFSYLAEELRGLAAAGEWIDEAAERRFPELLTTMTRRA